MKFYIFFLSIAYFHGQTFTVDHHRKDVASLLPATFVTASMKALNPGTWMLNCLVNDHYNAGMYALFNVTKCDGKDKPVLSVSGGKKRTYYIAANEIPWNYGPTGTNNMNGESLTLADRYELHDQISNKAPVLTLRHSCFIVGHRINLTNSNGVEPKRKKILKTMVIIK